MSEEMSFGQWLKLRRTFLHLSRPALAQQTSCSAETIKAIEDRGLKPSEELARQLLTQLDIPADQVAEGVRWARGGRSLPPMVSLAAADHTHAASSSDEQGSPAPDLLALPPTSPLPENGLPPSIAFTGRDHAAASRVAPPAPLLALGIALLSLVVAILALRTRPLAVSTGTAIPAIRPGGLWLSPTNGQVVTTTVLFIAHAYPTHVGDPQIAYVNFTVSWPGRRGPWLIACRVTKPGQTDQYSCVWTPSKKSERVPAGRLQISFDVYDAAGHHNNAPNGVHTISYMPHRTTISAP